jgi:hypothetical protein
MAETQTKNPEAEQAAFDRFVATHPNTQKKTWGEKRKPRRSLRETLRGPGGRHETTRPGERLREVREKARRLGELGVGLVLYGPAVLRAKRDYERAQRERLAIDTHKRPQLEGGEAARSRASVDALFRGTAQVNHSRVRATHSVEAPIYTPQAFTEGRHAAGEIEAAPVSAPAAESFDDIVDHAEQLEQPIAATTAGKHRKPDPLSSPLYNLRETVGEDDNLPLFKQSLDAVSPPAPADDSDLLTFHEAKHAVEQSEPEPHPVSGMRNHRTYFVDHRLKRR